MKRNAINGLIKWKAEEYSAPFLLTGTKGTGKTYLAIEFATDYFPQYLYVNFELNRAARHFFNDSILNGKTVVHAVAQYFQMDEEYLNNLAVIFDEISYCPTLFKAISGSKQLPIIAISGISPTSDTAINFVHCKLFPLCFDEFLSAVGNDWYVDIIQGHFSAFKPVPDIVHQELLALFEEYLVVGGMPAAVNEYISSKSIYNVGEVHSMIKNRMRSVMESVYDEKESGKAQQIIRVIPEQLERENKKFRFNSIRKGVTYALYRDSILALEQSGMILRLNEENKETHFKLYLPDVGMLSSAFSGTGKNNAQTRKSLLENYVMQTLTAKSSFNLFYWESDAQARVDFVLKKNEHKTPVELRTSLGGKAKNIAAYRAVNTKKISPFSYRLGFENFNSTNVIRQIPYYALFCLE